MSTADTAKKTDCSRWVWFVEAHPQKLGDASDLRAVVERHHHDAEEDHRRNGADPVVMRGRDAVLRAVGGHTQDLESAEVRRDEREAGDPGGHCAAGQQEVEAGADAAPRQPADPENREEIAAEDEVVEPVEVKPHGAPRRESGRVSSNLLKIRGAQTWTEGFIARSRRSPLPTCYSFSLIQLISGRNFRQVC